MASTALNASEDAAQHLCQPLQLFGPAWRLWVAPCGRAAERPVLARLNAAMHAQAHSTFPASRLILCGAPLCLERLPAGMRCGVRLLLIHEGHVANVRNMRAPSAGFL